MTSERKSQPGPQPGPQPDPQPGPQSEGDAQTDRPEPLTITDPMIIRALAHPVRMGLIELFGVRETLTATQASEALGESPANCAFHLRTLAKYGFIEEAGGGRGRERPWKSAAKAIRIRLRSSELDSEQAHVAAGALEQVWHDRWFSRVKEAFAARAWSPEWEGASGATQTLSFLTPDEVKTMRDEIQAIITRHLDERRVDPAKRPPGALPVEFVNFAYPRLDLAALANAESNGTDAGDAEDADAEDVDEDDEGDEDDEDDGLEEGDIPN